MPNKKIETLTPEQKALIPVYIEKWRQIALSTHRLDQQKAIEAVKAAYTSNAFREPDIIVVNSPYEGLLELSGTATRPVGSKLNQKVQHHNKWIVSIPQEFDSNLDAYLKKELYQPLSYLSQLFSPLNRKLETELLYTSKVEISRFYNNISPDSLAGSYCYFDFCISVLNCSHNVTQWETSLALLTLGGTIFPFERVCIICEPPTKICINEQNFLHAVGEPALVFADEFNVYAYYGALMPEKYNSVTPQEWQPQWYLEESDFRLRQAIIEQLPSEQLSVSWLLEENHAYLRQLLLQYIGFNRIYQNFQTIDNLNLLAQVLQQTESSDFWVAYTILHNQQEARINALINYCNTVSTYHNLYEIRKALLIDSSERIFYWLQYNAPSYTEGFLPGLSYEEIESKLSNLPFKVPKEVYDLYHWRNGTNSEASIFVYHYFWHLDMALEISEGLNHGYWLEARSNGGEPLYLFPIFEFEGEYFAVPGTTNQVDTAPVFHIGCDSGDVNLAFNSLTTMMLTIAESYEAGVYRLASEERLTWEDMMEQFGCLRLNYNPGASNRLYADGG